ncbi:type 4 pilus major pilin [Stenotrophomonas maltophilia]|uniref:type 4 pilus major pilin n=1 Tax=Stenotrophomonas maltophilia TaxID=40324 RepID=UPI000B4CE4C4|nr:type 4 pilus major pilin [Stenotrophomonas maltophilia]OWQ61363.1 pilus assembly protein PilS [Stenotrophomonas maltophilia]RRU72117.1 pilus assembly protein PilS [Stenotrophomonas maltophilia]
MKNRKQFRSKKSQLGLTAIELGVCLIVVAVVFGLAAANGSKLWGDSESTNEISNVSSLVSQTRGLKSVNGYGTSGTSLLPQLDSLGALPKSMPYSTGTLTNAWGGNVTLVSTGSGFTLTYNSVPKANCIEMALKVSKSGALTTKAGTGAAIAGPLTAAEATTGCAAATNTVTFTSVS